MLAGSSCAGIIYEKECFCHAVVELGVDEHCLRCVERNSYARFVYVTAYDGDQFDPRLLPEDRAAIGRAEDAIQKWGKLSLVYRQQDADVVLGRSSLVHQRTCWLSMTRIAGHRRTISGA
jgi:hypothetical protein